MKKVICSVVFSFCILVGISAQNGPGCSDESFVMSCVSSIGESKFLKSFSISEPSNSKSKDANTKEYAYAFSKGSNYIVRVCNHGDASGEILVKLYDRNHKLKASNFDPVNKRYFGGFNYPCSVDGSYYFSLTYINSKKSRSQNNCGLTILGLKK